MCLCECIEERNNQILVIMKENFFFGVNKLEQTQAQTCNQTDILKFFLKGGRISQEIKQTHLLFLGTSKAKTHIHLLGTAQFNLIIISIP